MERRVTYFAIFDGHGGPGCSEYLKNNLHLLIAKSKYFPSFLEMALRDGCQQAEQIWIKKNSEKVVDRSGSCALICLVTNT
jgi:protein phosphatase 2C family protein 2/3